MRWARASRDSAPGQRVAWCIVRGAYADYAVVPAWRLVPVPDAVPLDIACALMLQGSTAHYLTHSAWRAACRRHLRRARGRRRRRPAPDPARQASRRDGDRDRRQRRRRRRSRVPAAPTTRFSIATPISAPTVLRITNGRGADVVYDSVGRDTIHASIRALRKRGLCVMFGASSGQVEAIAPLELAEAGSVYFTRPHLADYMRDATEIRARAQDLFGAVDGRQPAGDDRSRLSAARSRRRRTGARGARKPGQAAARADMSGARGIARRSPPGGAARRDPRQTGRRLGLAQCSPAGRGGNRGSCDASNPFCTSMQLPAHQHVDANPAASAPISTPKVAKFCSDCGSPLHLKPCPQCEAINDVTAETCYQCGAPFDAASVTVARVEAAEATATEALTQRAEASVADAVAQPTAASFAAAFAEPVAASVTDAFAEPVAASVTDAFAGPCRVERR